MPINSKPSDGSVPLAKAAHPFLEQDSWLHCHGERVETDRFKLASLLDRQRKPERRGVLGVIALAVRARIVAAIQNSPVLAPEKRTRIENALR